MYFIFLNHTFLLMLKPEKNTFCIQFAFFFFLQQTLPTSIGRWRGSHLSDHWHSLPQQLQQRPKCPPTADCEAAGPAALHGAQSVDEHTMRQAAVRQPPHHLHVRPKAVSPCCFYPHISVNARAHTHIRPLKKSHWQRAFVFQLNKPSLASGTFAYSSYSHCREMKFCFITWT